LYRRKLVGEQIGTPEHIKTKAIHLPLNALMKALGNQIDPSKVQNLPNHSMLLMKKKFRVVNKKL